MSTSKRETPVQSTDAPQKPSRDTATFTPYYWEAYNEIVNPRRFDWYLVEKWLPELGPLGFAIVKTLRNAGYNNRETGVVRDEIRMEIAELAARCGVSEPTIHRQFRNNEALQQFVVREQKFRMVNGHPEQCANSYRVCMDDPIHPDDMERYELLRCQKEIERTAVATSGKRKTLDNQNDSQPKKRGAVDNQIDSVDCQNDRAGLTIKMTEHKDILPSEFITKESNTPQVAAVPPINPPEGEEEGTMNTAENRERRALILNKRMQGLSAAQEERLAYLQVKVREQIAEAIPKPFSALDAESPHAEVWESVLSLVKDKVNTPTYEGHIRLLRLISITDTTDRDEGADRPKTAVLQAQSAFTRDWVEKRNGDVLTAAFGQVLGHGVQLQFTTR